MGSMLILLVFIGLIVVAALWGYFESSLLMESK